MSDCNKKKKKKSAMLKSFSVGVCVCVRVVLSALLQEDVYFLILPWAAEITQNSALVLIE